MSLSYSVLPTVNIHVPSMPDPNQLGYHSNNLYDNFPPIMSDGRTVIASYQPDALTNQTLIQENNIKTNTQNHGTYPGSE